MQAQRWRQKPIYGTRLDLAHPWTQGLAFFTPINAPGGSSVYDAVTKLPLLVTGGATMGYGLWRGLNCNANGAGAGATIPPALQLNVPVTFMIGLNVVATASGTSPYIGLFQSYNSTNRALSFEINQLFFVWNGANSSTISYGLLPGDVVLAMTATASVYTAYANGLQVGQNTGLTITAGAYTGTAQLVIGNANSSVFASRNPGIIPYWAGIWSRVVSTDEIAAMGTSQNSIWQMFEPPRGVLYNYAPAVAPSFKPWIYGDQVQEFYG